MVMVQHLGVTGLWTDPNPHTGDVPEGAMRLADEVVFRRKGTVEPRPGFKLLQTFSGLSKLYGLLAFDDAYLAVGLATSTNTTWWSNGTAVTNGTSTLQWSRDAIRAEGARKNLYLTTADVVRKVSQSSDAVAYPAGLMQPLAGIYVTNPGTAVVDQRTVAYRLVLRSTDANGVIVRSTPSGRVISENTSGVTVANTLVLLHGAASGYRVGMTVEVYRSRSVSNTLMPPDELFLAAEYVLVAADMSNNYVYIVDDTIDDDLGSALYTNSSREGIERANVPPPLCRDLALYAGSLFAARITWPHQLLLRLTEVGGALGATGVGARGFNGIRTLGSNQITSVSAITGAQVGQALFYRADWLGTAPVRITAIVGTTWTMSEQWNGATDGVAQAMTVLDTVRISDGVIDRYYPISSVVGFLASLEISIASFGDTTTPSVGVDGFAIGNSIMYENYQYVYGSRRAFGLSAPPSASAFEVWATHGDEYEPPLPLPTAADGLSSVQDDTPNGIAWSKADQPEHFMRGARWLVGREDVPVLRVLTAGDALWILKGKGDGIYRLTGFGERSGWRVDQRSADTYLLYPQLATVLGDAVYAWTNKGAVEISDRGIIPLSESPLGAQFADLQINLDHTATAPGAFAVANEKNSEVIFGLPPDDFATDANDGRATRVYVLNTENRAWSRWFAEAVYADQLSCAMYNPSTRLLVFGRGGAGETRVERGPAESYVRNADLERTVTISTIVGDTITIAGGSGWTPVAGDVLRSGTGLTIVTGIASATVFTVDDGAVLTTGAGKTAYEQFDVTLQWLTKTGSAPGLVKRFREVVTHWEDTYGIYAWEMGFEPLKFGAAAGRSYTRAYARTAETADDTRAHVPRAAALGSRLGLSLEISQADARWRLSGLTVEMEPAGARIAR